MIVLLALGIAVAVVGLSMLREEWRRADRPPRPALRLEVVGAAGLLIGIGVVMGYVGVSA